MTLEDPETKSPAIVAAHSEQFRPVVIGARLVSSDRSGAERAVIHVVAEDVRDLTTPLLRLSEPSTAAPLVERHRHPRAGATRWSPA